MAGITTPFTTPVFPFLQTVSQRTLDNVTPALTPYVVPITIVILLALGFLPALIFSWAFELTPHGLKRDEGVPHHLPPPGWSATTVRLVGRRYS